MIWGITRKVKYCAGQKYKEFIRKRRYNREKFGASLGQEKKTQ